MRPCIIMHQYCRPMPLNERNSFRLQNVVNVTLSIEVALQNNEICFPSAHNATPYHNTPTSKSVPLNETIISKTFPSSLKTRIRQSWWLRLNLDSSENRTRAHCCRPPTEMPSCPLQTGSPMTCCKHLSHIGPPWPNGLPGLPEAAQHCLFADIVLPCRTCRRLKKTSKVRQRNEPVRSRVCNSRSIGSTAICHPTCFTVFLWKPNALLKLETLSPRVSIVYAWIRWFWFSPGMFSDKRCEIKVYPVLPKTVISTTTITTKHPFVLHGRDPYIWVTSGAIASTGNKFYTGN